MNIDELTTDELLVELRKRSLEEVKEKNEPTLVLGTIGINGEEPFIEVFKKVESVEDLDCLDMIKMRSRFNPSRHYRGFYFKTNNFDKLNKNLNDNNLGMVEWVMTSSSIKFFKL